MTSAGPALPAAAPPRTTRRTDDLQSANPTSCNQCRAFCSALRDLAAHQQRHGDVLHGGEFRQEIVKLPDKSEFAAAKLSGISLPTASPNQIGRSIRHLRKRYQELRGCATRYSFPRPIHLQSRAFRRDCTSNDKFSKSTNSEGPERNAFLQVYRSQQLVLCFRCRCTPRRSKFELNPIATLVPY